MRGLADVLVYTHRAGNLNTEVLFCSFRLLRSCEERRSGLMQVLSKMFERTESRNINLKILSLFVWVVVEVDV